MSLYGKDDSNANKTKAGRGIAASSQAKQTIFIDDTEAALAENKARGLNAPGWWSYFTYTDTEGNTRHKAEMLVTIADPEANSSETQADDAVAADVSVVIAIGTQPATAEVTAGDAHTLSVVATATPPGDASVLTYQWQKLSEAGRWTNISSATSASYAIASYAADDAGSYRVKINSTNGAPEVTSATAVLTTAE
ncbi:virion structural protein [Synechococcus phage S-CAM1]|uniref:Virion structural protein n=1 Tax=Synechococcus phage S-CAM1 TaxID=754037 RepID=A0A1D8KIL3_9CAUD|nr:virion structural protein [Synechococcus phage S-CAM1]